MSGVPGGPVILLVEDNRTMRALIHSLVERVASAVHECDDGGRALEVYRRVHADWVLMDIELRGLDGIAATRAIVREDPDARVIIVTEHGQDDYRRAAREAGACGFVLKEDLLGLPAMLTGSPRSSPNEGI